MYFGKLEMYHCPLKWLDVSDEAIVLFAFIQI